MSCTACDDGRCEESFTCLRCGETKNSCRHRVGGFDADWDLCSACFEEMTLPVAVLAYIRRRWDRIKSVEGGGMSLGKFIAIIVLAGSLLWVSPASAVEGACPVWKAKEDVATAKRSLARAETRLREARRVLAATQLYSERYGAGTGRWVRASRRAGWEWSNIGTLMLVVDTESGGNPSALSPTGYYAGLMQIGQLHADKFEEVTGRPYFDAALCGPPNLKFGRFLWRGGGWGPWPWLTL